MKNKIAWSVFAALIASFVISSCKNQSSSNKAIGRTNAANAATTDNRANTSAAPAAPQGNSNVNVANFNRLQTGMNYAEVVKILGSEGEVMGITGTTGAKTVMYKWNGEVPGSFMQAIFQNDILVDKVHTLYK